MRETLDSFNSHLSDLIRDLRKKEISQPSEN